MKADVVILNLRGKPVGTDRGCMHVRVDRRSILGNPFYMDSESARNKVCDQYKEYFDKKVADKDPMFMRELERLVKLAKSGMTLYLYCWCAPKRCHAETIKEYIEMKCREDDNNDAEVRE